MEKLFTKNQLIEMVRDNYRWNHSIRISAVDYSDKIQNIVCSKGTGINKFNKKELVEAIKELQEVRQLKLK